MPRLEYEMPLEKRSSWLNRLRAPMSAEARRKERDALRETVIKAVAGLVIGM